MKRFSILISVIFLLMFASHAFAHPPSDIIFNFDSRNNILSIGVVHMVQDAQKHFIGNISVNLNGNKWLMQNFLIQTNLQTQAVSYVVLGLKKGDVIEVTAACNQKGQLKKAFKIE